MVRKLLLTSVIILVGPESYTQLCVGALLSTMALCLHAQFRPYPEPVSSEGVADTSDFWLQYISLSALAISILIGIALRGQVGEAISLLHLIGFLS